MRVIRGAKPIERSLVRATGAPPAEKYSLDDWLQYLGEELSHLGSEERGDVDAVFGALEPAFVEQGWSGAYWEVNGPVAVLRQVIAPEKSGSEFAVPLVGVAVTRAKVPRVFDVVDSRRARFVELSAFRGVPLFSSGAFVPVYEGERVAGVLAVAAEGLTDRDLPFISLLSHHLAVACTVSLPSIPPASTTGLERISAVIASEIREPVRHLSSMSGRLRERLSRDADLGPLSFELDRGATHLKLLVEDLLDYTRPLIAWPDSLPLDIVTRSVLVSVQRVYREACHGRAIVLEVERPAPVARVDPALVSRALGNVIVSVVERSLPSCGVSVSVHQCGNHAQIDVMCEDQSAPADHPWEGLDISSPDVRHRHAIGLAVARRLVRATSGRLVLERHKTGVTYSLRLPLAYPDPSA